MSAASPLLLRWLLACLLGLGLARAEPGTGRWLVRTWQTDDGLPNNTVTSLAQTPDGYLWLTTPPRVTRFDGVRFEAMPRNVLGLEYAQQTPGALLPSADGGLWIALNQGPVVHARGGVTTVNARGLPDEIVQTLTEDADGALWITYRNDVVCRLKNGEVTRLTAAVNGLRRGSSCSFARDRDGTLWWAKAGAIGVVREGRLEDVLVTGRTDAIRLVAARDGGLWVARPTQLLRFTAATGLRDCGTFQPEQPAIEIHALLEDRRGGVWIGTGGNGLIHFDGQAFETIPTPHRVVTSLLEDREGNIWVGTSGGGVSLVRPSTVRLETLATGLPTESVQSLCEDAAGRLWAATQNGFLICRADGKWTNISARPDWPGGQAACVTAEPDGTLWIATRNRSVHRWRNGRYTTWGADEEIRPRNIHGVFVSRKGEVWIAGTGPEGLQRLRNGRWETLALPPNVRVIRAMAEDAVGDLWLGTSKGMLLRASGDRVIDETARMGGLLSIRCLEFTADGALWIGFADFGLGRLKNGRFARLGSEQGLRDDYISQILPDGRGWFWLGANQGIFKVRQDDLERVLDGHATQVRSIVYGRGDGLPSLQANAGVTANSLRDREGRLWMPMSTGLAVVDPAPQREQPAPPPVLLRRMLVDDTPVATYGGVLPASAGIDLQRRAAHLQLAPRHQRVAFEFTALTFAGAENLQFRYRLDGLEDNWSEAGAQREVTYSRLPAGNYTFRVQASHGNGIWNETTAPLAFNVAPFFWQTWWFRVVALASFTAAIVAIVRYVSFRRLRQQLRTLEQQQALAKERARIARDIHDDVGNRLTQITLLSSLAWQDRAEPAKTAEHVEQISSTAHQITNSLDEIVWAVNPRNDTLPHLIGYLGQFALEFLRAAGVQPVIDMPDHSSERMVPSEVRHTLFLVVKEALHNVVRHAGARTATLRVTIDDHAIALEIADDGRGFARVPSPDHGQADGLRNMRQRMEEIGGSFELHSTPGAGTRIALRYPWLALERN